VSLLRHDANGNENMDAVSMHESERHQFPMRSFMVLGGAANISGCSGSAMSVPTNWCFSGSPRHFHLLSDQDLQELRPILEAILKRRSEVVCQWHQLYALHFGDSRALSEGEFTDIFEPALEHSKLALLKGNMDEYAAQVARLVESLVERRVPLDEVIASLHLFKKSAQGVFVSAQDSPQSQLPIAFDKLIHVSIILLVSAYFRSPSAVAGEGIAALER
jgi:hypothetical protein